MADNKTLPATGTGTANIQVATDEIAGVDYQKVKLVDGTADSTALIAGDATNGLDVDVTRVQGTVSVQGDTAHGATNAGNPSQLGAVAIAHGTNPTAVAAGQRTKLYASRAGVPFFIGGHPNIVTLEFSTTTVQTDVAIITISAGTKIVVTQAQVIANNLNTVYPAFRMGFGATTTPTTTGVVLTHPGVPAGGGISRGDGSGILGIGADAEDLRMTCEVPTGGSLRVLVSYYTIES